MPRSAMINGNYAYMDIGGHYKSGLGGLASLNCPGDPGCAESWSGWTNNPTQAELDATGLSASDWQGAMDNLYGSASWAPNAAGVITLGPNRGGSASIGSWLSQNWTMLLAGGLIAMIALPHLSNPSRRR